MHLAINTKKFQSFFLLLFFFSFSTAWGQNPVVSLSGGPCTGSTLTVTSNATPTQVVFLLNGTAVSTSAATTYVAAAAGTYTATVTTATGSATTQGVTISALATPSIVITAFPGSTSICAGINVNLNATVTTAGTAPVYQWKKNGNPVGTNSPTFGINTLATGDVINCTLISNDACASPATASSNNITYTITAPLTPSVSITGYPANNTICSGTLATFVATPVSGGSTPTYRWYVNSTLMLTTGVDSFTTTTLNNNDTVYCELTTSVPCATVETALSNKIGMVVATSLTPSATITANTSDTICDGSQVTFTANSLNGGSAPQYQWTKNGSPIASATGTTYQTSALVNNDIIGFTLTSNATCATSATASSNNITLTVNQIGTPAVTISAPNDTLTCTGNTVVFTAVPVFGGTAPVYAWIKNGNVIPALGSLNTASVTGLATGDVISCTLTSSEPCATTTTATSNAITMTVNPQTTMTLAITASPGTSITVGDVVVFTATVTNAGSAFNYQWYVNGVAKTGSISPTYSSSTLANNDVVTCKVTSTELCLTNPVVTSNALTMSVASGIASVNKGALSVDLFPNPNNGNFTLRGIVNNTKGVNLEVSNLMGQVVYNSTVATTNGKLDTQITLPTLPNGLYQVKLKTTNATEVLKFVLDK